MDDDLLFNLVPIENLQRDDESKKFIAKESYFRLQHVNTKKWISFQEDTIGAGYEDKKTKERTSSVTPTLSSYVREVDTFKIIKADFEEIWETSFLLSAFPILIDLVDYMGPLVISEI